ncbi:hypothetical protein G6F46_008302 [Rhizopus delemar]|uniref:BTB domain-containing protein n=2 Tax=Rhizopus TaxID=4842 RepID=A0A9P6Z129_9FUNG|nr:hypothetical protein G6F55_007273 [Rhizopus delemar]KAG1549577.1 hypothetical protein G6F51_002970 [Rhizopus arrhizus]KAG1494548.1 hypothetical protein G6F54_007803 [Rhizopus delemar]KAG1508583.1 hypothetical protein G6F53_008090 [Rhizopus delemar]KAG1524115.1 hypothetical protein G6F52_004465 [Rhizopus delemar]
MESHKRKRQEDNDFDFLNIDLSANIPNDLLATNNVLNSPPISNQTAFTIVVGSKSFRLSWESLKSDGPSNFFTEYFNKKRNTKTVYVDRDPETFNTIVKHLRGYYIRPVNDVENQSLLSDAHFYGLKRLEKMLHEYLFVNVGGRSFRLPWSLFGHDDKANLFNGPLKYAITSSPNASNSSPLYIDRDPDMFQDIVHLLRGYTIDIKSEVHRENLLKDSQYYAFKQLTDKLSTAKQTVAFNEGPNSEILLQLNDVRLMNLLIPKSTNLTTENDDNWQPSQLRYKRNDSIHRLLVQVNDLCVNYDMENNKMVFEMKDKTKMKSIGQAMHVAINTNLYFDQDCAVMMDNEDIKTYKELVKESKFIIEKAICGIHLIDNMITLHALKIEAITSRFKLNLNRQFLPSTHS